jgi:hypothetical protein
MTYKELALTRITPKFSKANNYKNILRFMVDIFDETVPDVQIIKDLKNLESTSTIVLNELGKLLGVYPRPYLEIGNQAIGFFQYDTNGYDQVPYIGENDKIRQLTNLEYTRLLKAVATLTAFNGTIDDWIKFYTAISGDEAVIVNKTSIYDIIIKKELTDFDKRLIEFLSDKVDNLTISRGFLGTSDSVQPFQYGLSAYGIAPYIKTW